ncbi:hypothetical protein C8A03DRAFT_39077 [Achaetomium macrosporum]|uniref:Uncharacterized protein n=1 Tax=Achaetomium macrosporum TaxID=79813 RepID=A0AAN7C0T4_9PEZI|nr:hypothetical protein C8A03DRAFT_39077 [Achaetomium macrosporum]
MLRHPDAFTSALVEQVLAARPPENGKFRIVPWADGKKDEPAFPQWTALGPIRKPRVPTTWATQAAEWATRSGFAAPCFGLHAARPIALIRANDHGYSLGQILKFASQRNTNVLVNHYLSNVSSIDEELKNSQEYVSLETDIERINKTILQTASEEVVAELKSQRKFLYDKLRGLRRRRLAAYQRQQKLKYETAERHEQTDWRQCRFDRICHVLHPARRRLARTLCLTAAPRSEEWVSALKDLVELRNSDCSIAYQDVLRPVGGNARSAPAVAICKGGRPTPTTKPTQYYYYSYTALP